VFAKGSVTISNAHT